MNSRFEVPDFVWRWLVPLMLVGCAGVPGQEPWTQTELYFGLGRVDQSVVGTDEWTEFVASQITPRFPDGFTVVDARGYWRQSDGYGLSEASKILIVVHRDDPSANGSIEAIRSAYKEMFEQESVLRVNRQVEVRFQ